MLFQKIIICLLIIFSFGFLGYSLFYIFKNDNTVKNDIFLDNNHIINKINYDSKILLPKWINKTIEFQEYNIINKNIDIEVNKNSNGTKLLVTETESLKNELIDDDKKFYNNEKFKTKKRFKRIKRIKNY